MKKTLLALTAVIALTTSAHADYYGHHHHHYQGGGGGNDWAGPLIGGLIIGGMLGAMSQPRYDYAPQPYYYQPQTYCRTVPVFDYYGRMVGRQRQCWTE